MTPPKSKRAILTTICSAEVLSMLPLAAVPALLPTFIDSWNLSKTEAGWITGTYYLGYLGTVPFLVSLTDRKPAKNIYLACMALSAMAAFGYAFLAEGFWMALLFRTLSGIGLAGTYMPGLKLLADQLDRPSPESITAAQLLFTRPASASARRYRTCWPASSPVCGDGNGLSWCWARAPC